MIDQLSHLLLLPLSRIEGRPQIVIHNGKVFEDVDFSGAHFQNKVTFRDARFNGKTNFSGATFEGPADFTGAQFLGVYKPRLISSRRSHSGSCLRLRNSHRSPQLPHTASLPSTSM